MSAGSLSVSIVLATRNRCEWLSFAMDTVLEQDYPDLELLVLDDGSTDGTTQLLEEYARRYPRERFRFERHDQQGQARSINRGYQLARGDLLGYHCDDDLFSPGAVSRLVREFEDPAVVAAYPGYHIIDGDGATVDTIRPIEYSSDAAFRSIDTVIGPACLVRRPVLESTGGWDPSLRFMPDFILWMKVGLAGTVARVPLPLASWRRHPTSISLQTGADHGIELLRLVELGSAVLELSREEVATSAEALRNACIQAAFFSGGSGPSPGERFAAIDLTRPGISSVSSGLAPTEMPDRRADRAAELWRQLGGITLRLAQVRTGESKAGEPGAGLDAALDRLRRAGALPDEHGRADAWSQRDPRMELMYAAVECGADTDLPASRYLLLERSGGVTDEEFDELNELGYGAGPERLEAVIAARERELSRLGGLPSATDR